MLRRFLKGQYTSGKIGDIFGIGFSTDDKLWKRNVISNPSRPNAVNLTEFVSGFDRSKTYKAWCACCV
jgi:hypothetical protein